MVDRAPDQGAVVGWPGPVPVRQAPGEGSLRLAGNGGRGRRADAGAARHSAERHRLARPSAYGPASHRGLTQVPATGLRAERNGASC